MRIILKTKLNIKIMVKFRVLKFVLRLVIPRNWRCHGRRVFFERLFEDIKEVKDRRGSYVSGYIRYTELSYNLTCHEMAANIPFYPFDKRSYINIGKFFADKWPQSHYFELRARIIRLTSLWKLILGYGKYEVLVSGVDNAGKQISYTYEKNVKLF